LGRTRKYFDRIAELHAGIWFEDDRRNYEKLESLAGELVFMRINDSVKAATAASIIRESYEAYGRFDDDPAFALEAVFDDLIFMNFKIFYGLLDESNPGMQAKRHMLWWKHFFLKDRNGIFRAMRISLSILLYHRSKRISLVLSCLLASVLIRAGVEHSKRNFAETKRHLKSYWAQLDSINSQTVVF